MATTERNLVAEARQELAAAEADYAALVARLATDKSLTHRHLRDSEDRLTFARQKVEAAEQHTETIAKADITREYLGLYERAVRLKAELAKLERLGQRFNMLRDEYDAAVCNVNIWSHGLSSDGQALEAKAQRLGVELREVDAAAGVGGYEWFAQRLQGGARIGDVQVPKFQIPIVSGGYDPGLANAPIPVPPPPPAGPVCYERKEGGGQGRGFQAHILTRLDHPHDRPLNGQRCERCGRRWTAQEAFELWGIPIQPRRVAAK